MVGTLGVRLVVADWLGCRSRKAAHRGDGTGGFIHLLFHTKLVGEDVLAMLGFGSQSLKR